MMKIHVNKGYSARIGDQVHSGPCSICIEPESLEKPKRPARKPPSELSLKIADALYESIISWGVDFQYDNKRRRSWAADADKLVRLDKAEPDEILKVIKALPNDPFWRKIVLSANKLRKHYDRLRLLSRVESEVSVKKFKPVEVDE